MAKTFKVGDKVRILNVSKIKGGNSHWSNGDIAEVLDVRERDGGLRLTRVKTGTYNGFGPVVIRGEYAGIELVNATPTKKQRIQTLENEVEALKARVAELEKRRSTKLSDITANVKCDADIAKIAEELASKLVPQTPNQRRKAVIDRAKAFVADVEKGALVNVNKNEELGNGNFTYEYLTTEPEYHVNKEKRVVTVLIKGANSGKLKGKAIARCAPGDVFNEHIGKAIALAKAYGLACLKEFTDAPQPEIAVGQYAKVTGNVKEYTAKVCTEIGKRHAISNIKNDPSRLIAILDDTEAQYE